MIVRRNVIAPVFSVVLGVFTAVASVSASPLAYRTVALTGTDGVYGPGLGAGVTFNLLDGPPAMNLTGQVVFRGADISTGGLPNGLWMRPDATNTSFNLNLAIENGPQPGGGVYSTGNSYNSMAINNAGDTAFRIGASKGAFSSDAGTMQRVALAGDFAPGTGNATYATSAVASGSPLFNQAGQTAYVGSLTVGTGSPPVSISSNVNNSQCIYVGKGDNANNPNANNTCVLRGTDWFASLGGTSADTKINSPTQSTMSLNGNGSYVVSTTLQGTAIVTGTGATSNSVAIVSNRTGSNDVVARVGNAAPDSTGAPSADVYRTLGSSAIGFNNLGHVSFVSSLRQGATQTNASALFTDINGGTLKRFASAGGTIGNVYALGDTSNTTPLSEFTSLTYGTSATFSTALLNSNDEMLFSANLSSGGQAYFRTDLFGNLHRAVRIGDIAFSPDPLSTGGTGTSTISGVNNITMNALGQVAFLSNISGPGVSVGLGNGSVLWATELDGTMDPVVRSGTQFTDGLGNTHTIASINLALNSGNEDGRASSFNDAGFLAFNLQFTDGTAGDFVTQIPEPAAIGFVLISGLFFIRRRG
ncbi:MAG TPA: choice-of-anchor tandem repeat NxxGxxAF-containing protein [Phycisphaerae bacterium]|nr:choice-of-anchor tandem repeat NxxGxxAF-containing protein [Phycisphaerae bacterium]